jgi:SAM-dependent methyltransferase
MSTPAAHQWREQLAAWALPERITAAVATSPWACPTEVFARRADHYVATPVGVSYERAAEALRPAGTVLDVGAGAGAASLPLAPWTTELTAVDSHAGMLAALAERAGRLNLTARTVEGRWPDVADEVSTADVVVCHHVAYNVPDLAAFAVALTDHARRLVVLELTDAHPMRVLNPLWLRLHGLERPSGPTAADAVAVLRETGIEPEERHWQRPLRPEYDSFDELLAATRRRLCLPPERDEELTKALLDLGVDPEHPRDLGASGDELVTLWWPGTAR